MRNYINAIIEFHDSKERTEVIFKMGDIDVDDDTHVFDYIKSESDLEDLMKQGNDEFRVIEFWKGKKEDNFTPPGSASNENFFEDWGNDSDNQASLDIL